MTLKNKKAALSTALTLALLTPFLGVHEAFARIMVPVERQVLSNQLTLLVSEEHSLPLVTCQVLLDAGSRRDPSGKEGLANLTVRGLLQGTTERDAGTFSEALDFMGASLNASAYKDYVTLTLRVLKKDLEDGFRLLMEALTKPAFPEEEIEGEIQRTMAAIRTAEGDPRRVAARQFRKALFLSGPYAHPIEGTESSISLLSRSDIHRFFRTYYHPDSSILAIVGDITVGEVKEKLIPLLLEWPTGPIPGQYLKSRFANGSKTVKINREITQANIILGHRGVRRENPDYYALTLMNYILGGAGFGSRLFEHIRVKRGLAYSVRSRFEVGKSAGSFQIVLQTKNASAREAVSIAVEQMRRMQKEKVSAEELKRAKNNLTGSFPLQLDTQEKLARFLTKIEFYDLGLDYPDRYSTIIKSITREDVLRVAKTYLHPEECILVVVGDLEKAGMETASAH